MYCFCFLYWLRWLFFHVDAQDTVSDDGQVVDSLMWFIDVGFCFVAFFDDVASFLWGRGFGSTHVTAAPSAPPSLVQRSISPAVPGYLFSDPYVFL